MYDGMSTISNVVVCRWFHHRIKNIFSKLHV